MTTPEQIEKARERLEKQLSALQNMRHDDAPCLKHKYLNDIQTLLTALAERETEVKELKERVEMMRDPNFAKTIKI